LQLDLLIHYVDRVALFEILEPFSLWEDLEADNVSVETSILVLDSQYEQVIVESFNHDSGLCDIYS